VERLSALVRRYAAERNNGEQFGDFCHRIGEVPAPAA
jgi:sulfite reductase beta subunit-like hemoprotein